MSTLLQINNLAKSYGAQDLFKEATVTIAEKQKLAVVGRNGAGKSTLFRMIVGEEDYDQGSITIHDRARLGYLTQHSDFTPEETVIEFLQRSSQAEDWACAKMAARFQLTGELLDRQVSSLPGGYQMRTKLVNLLLKEPNLLLLDEPTNYLDLSTQLLLEEFLKTYRGGFLLISHDREFIKNTCNETLEIEHGKITLYPGPLEEYLTYKADQTELKEKFNLKVDKEKQHLQKFVDRFGAKASKAAQAQSKLKQIHKLKKIEILNPLKSARIIIPKVESKKGIALHVEDLSIGYPDKTVSKNITLDIARGEHVAIVGDNGQGKTTFLKTIAEELAALDGSWRWGANIKVGYYAQHVPATLNSTSTVKSYLENSASSEVRIEEVMAMAGNFLFNDTGLKKEISVLSGGEKARLCLAKLLLEKNNVLLLDEPTNHLDFETVEALALALKETNSTVIFVSHNRTFVEILANGIVQFKNGQVSRYLHNYEEYVYHLQLDIERELQGGSTKNVQTSSKLTPSEQKQKRIALREKKKQLQKLENQIATLEAKKEELLAWFEANFDKHTHEKNAQLGDLNKSLQTKETEWMSLQAEIDELES